MTDAAKSIGLAADAEERRDMPRCAVEASATLVVLSQGSMMVCRITEISLSGCRLLLPRTLNQARNASVECAFKVRGVGFRLGGVLEWAENNLAGVQFNSMSARARDDLMEVLCEVELENNARLAAGTSAAAEAPAEGSEAIEAILAEAAARAAGQPRLQAATWNPFAGWAAGRGRSKPLPPKAPVLASVPPTPISAGDGIRSVPSGQTAAGAASVPRTATGETQPAPKSPHAGHAGRGRDRRETRRCGVDTSAIIDLVKVGSKLKGQIVDLSVGGCRIRTDEKFPVGIYTRIETEFQLHGLPFRLGGVIQVIHDRNTVGIRFLDMSQRKKDQVAELVAEIEESQSR